MLAARARVLMDTRSTFIATLTSPDITSDMSALQAIPLHYMAAVASMQLRDTLRARSSLEAARKLVRQLPSTQAKEVRRLLDMAEVECTLQRSETLLAAQQLSEVIKADGVGAATRRPELMIAAHIALAMPPGEGQKTALQLAAANLQTHLSEHGHDIAAWGLLSELWQHLNEPIRAVRAEAEASAAKGDVPGAIDRVVGAQKRFRQPNAADVIELSVMEARRRVWVRQLREDMLEDGGR